MCPHCGIRLPGARGARYCPHCGARVALVARTCLMCGESLEAYPRPSRSQRLSLPIPAFVIPLAIVTVVVGLVALALTVSSGRRQTDAIETRLATPQVTATPMTTPTNTPSPIPTFTPPPPVVHVVKPGDSLISIAIWYGSTVEAIMKANDIEDPRWIGEGQELIVPIPTSTVQASPQSTPSIEVASVATVEKRLLVHIVEPGDSPSSIAARYGTTVEAIMKANEIMDPRQLQIGQELVIPSTAPTGGFETTVVETIIHTIEPGDTLSSIAIQYGASVEAIMETNDIKDPRLLRVGEQLIVPLGTPTPVPTSTPRPTPTFTPGPPYPVPSLLAPAEGAEFHGDQPVLLNWASVGILAEDEWYVVRLRYMAEEPSQMPSVWTKATSWRVPASLRPGEEAESHLFHWSVTVVLETEVRADGSWEGLALSPMSTTRSFYWY